MMTKISVIIPNYNRATLIGETIENVLNQSLPPFEVIIVDDGSTDDSVNVIRGFGEKVRLITQTNRGPGAARNCGFEAATGEFIQFFDSDDVMTRNKFAIQAGILSASHNADFVYGPYVRVAKAENKWEQLDAIMQYYKLPDRPLNHIVGEGWCLLTQACLFRRDLVERAGPWREDLMPHEDKEYWYRIGKVSRGAVHENQTCVFYRQHQEQITDLQVKHIARTVDAIKALDVILDQMKYDNVSVLARISCSGLRAGYVRYLNDQNNFEFRNSFRDIIHYGFHRAVEKLGRWKTRSNWQPYHGALVRNGKFSEYTRLVESY